MQFSNFYSPHTPPEVILDQRVEAVTLFVASELEAESRVPSDEEASASAVEPGSQASFAELAVEEERMQQMMKAIDDNPHFTEEEKASKKRTLMFAFKKKKERSLVQQKVAEEMRLKTLNKKDFYFDDQVCKNYFHIKLIFNGMCFLQTRKLALASLKF